MPHRIDKFLPYAGYSFNQNRMRKRILGQKSSIALYPFVLVRILSAMIARCPWRINWSHLALAINLARVRRTSGSCPRACVTAWCNVVVGVLVDYRLSSTISAPEVLVRPHIEMTVVDRMGAYGFLLYISDGHERAREFRLGVRLGLSSSLGMGSGWYIYSRFSRFSSVYQFDLI